MEDVSLRLLPLPCVTWWVHFRVGCCFDKGVVLMSWGVGAVVGGDEMEMKWVVVWCNGVNHTLTENI